MTSLRELGEGGRCFKNQFFYYFPSIISCSRPTKLNLNAAKYSVGKDTLKTNWTQLKNNQASSIRFIKIDFIKKVRKWEENGERFQYKHQFSSKRSPFLGWLIISKTRSFLAFDTIKLSFSSICYPIFPSFSLKSKT